MKKSKNKISINENSPEKSISDTSSTSDYSTDESVFSEKGSQSSKPDSAEQNTSTVTDSISEKSSKSHGLYFIEKLRSKRERMKSMTADMSRHEKFNYYFYYYKWHVLVLLVLVLFALYAINSICRNSRPRSLAFAMLNPAKSVNISATDSYLKYYKYNSSSYLMLSDKYFVNEADFEHDENAGVNSPTYLQLPVICQGGEYDFMITDAAGLDYASRQEIAFPLTSVFSGSYLDNYKSFLISAATPEAATLSDAVQSKMDISDPDSYGISKNTNFSSAKTTTDTDADTSTDTNASGSVKNYNIYAFDISDTSFCKNLSFGSDNTYLIITGRSKASLKRTSQFIDYIYSNK